MKKETPKQTLHNTDHNKFKYFSVAKHETLEEAAENYFPNPTSWTIKEIFKDGDKWQQERSYSEEEVLYLLLNCPYEFQDNIKSWFEQFKKK